MNRIWRDHLRWLIPGLLALLFGFAVYSQSPYLLLELSGGTTLLFQVEPDATAPPEPRVALADVAVRTVSKRLQSVQVAARVRRIDDGTVAVDVPPGREAPPFLAAIGSRPRAAIIAVPPDSMLELASFLNLDEIDSVTLHVTPENVELAISWTPRGREAYRAFAADKTGWVLSTASMSGWPGTHEIERCGDELVFVFPRYAGVWSSHHVGIDGVPQREVQRGEHSALEDAQGAALELLDVGSPLPRLTFVSKESLPPSPELAAARIGTLITLGVATCVAILRTSSNQAGAAEVAASIESTRELKA